MKVNTETNFTFQFYSITNYIFFIMNKGDLIDAISKSAGITKAQSQDAIETMTQSITGALKKGDKVTLVGFGTFSISKRNARVGRNPQTGKAIKIAARKVAKFKAGKELAEKIK